MQLGIIVITYNLSSEIFLLQIAALRKFCKDDFVIEVIDNSSDLELAEHIRYHAEQLGINYYKTFASSKNGSDSHSFAANFAHHKLKDQYEYLFYIDHDLVPMFDFSVVDILAGGHIAAGLGQGAKKKYMWPGAFMVALERINRDLVDFSPNAEFGLDTGGNLYKIIEQYGQENCIFFNESYHQNPNFNGHYFNHISVINNGMFYHCVNASNWSGSQRHEERMNAFVNIVKEKTGL